MQGAPDCHVATNTMCTYVLSSYSKTSRKLLHAPVWRGTLPATAAKETTWKPDKSWFWLADSSFHTMSLKTVKKLSFLVSFAINRDL
jgi:hypothetical protein